MNTIKNLINLVGNAVVINAYLNGEKVDPANYVEHGFELDYDENGDPVLILDPYTASDKRKIQRIYTFGAIGCYVYKQAHKAGKPEYKEVVDTLKAEYGDSTALCLIEAVADEVISVKGSYKEFDAEDIFDTISVEE